MQYAIIPANTLAAALVCAAKKDVRFYLNGVYVEPCADGHVIVVATDGKVMYASKCDREATDSVIEAPMILPREAVELVLKDKPTVVTVKFDGEYATLNDSVRCKPIDGRFPDWRRVVPESTNENDVTPQLAPDVLATVEKSRKAANTGERTAVMFSKGSETAGFMVKNNHLWIAMPVRVKPEDRPQIKPEWAC